tara:strand:- start:13792 stop:14496 length:705 start_codon:yes stop_codon:yes gene_type:complete
VDSSAFGVFHGGYKAKSDARVMQGGGFYEIPLARSLSNRFFALFFDDVKRACSLSFSNLRSLSVHRLEHQRIDPINSLAVYRLGILNATLRRCPFSYSVHALLNGTLQARFAVHRLDSVQAFSASFREKAILSNVGKRRRFDRFGANPATIGGNRKGWRIVLQCVVFGVVLSGVCQADMGHSVSQSIEWCAVLPLKTVSAYQSLIWKPLFPYNGRSKSGKLSNPNTKTASQSTD